MLKYHLNLPLEALDLRRSGFKKTKQFCTVAHKESCDLAHSNSSLQAQDQFP